MASNSSPNTSSSQTLIYQQIEQTADYYLPGLYNSLLTFQDTIEFVSDAIASQFIPVSDALNNPDKKKKLFVIGLIPPSSQVTGRLLDRSNSITPPNSTTDPVLTQSAQLTAQGNGIVSGTGGYGWKGQVTDGVPGSDRGPAVVTQMSNKQMAVAFRDAYTQRFGSTPTDLQVATFVGQAIRENSGGWPNYNPGNIGNYTPGTSYGDKGLANHQTFSFVNPDGSVAYYNSYSTAQAGAKAFIGNIYKCGGQAALDAAASGDTQGYCQALHDGGYFTDTVSDYAGHFANVQQLAAQIGPTANLNSGILPPPLDLTPASSVDTAAKGDWQSTGSSAAQQSAQQGSISQNSDLNNDTDTGRRYTQQQQALIRGTQLALQNMANTPPLRMIVNPSSFKQDSEQIIADGGWTRNGPADVVEHWGEQQDKLDMSGKIAAFEAIDLTTANGGPGLTRTARQYSASYQNFLSLYQLYRNNAGLYIPDNVEASDSGVRKNLSVLGSIYIYFDHIIYIGSFDTFTVTETDSSPFTLEYSITFSVRASFLLDQVQDPNFTYGIPQGGLTVQTPPTIPTTQSAITQAGTSPSATQLALDTAYNNAIGSGQTQTQAQASAVDATATAAVNNGATFNVASGAALQALIAGGS